MKQSTRLLTPNQAARIIRNLMNSGQITGSYTLQNVMQSLAIRPHKQKGPSKQGRVYRTGTNKYAGMEFPQTKEKARRVRQMARLSANG